MAGRTRSRCRCDGEDAKSLATPTEDRSGRVRGRPDAHGRSARRSLRDRSAAARRWRAGQRDVGRASRVCHTSRDRPRAQGGAPDPAALAGWAAAGHRGPRTVRSRWRHGRTRTGGSGPRWRHGRTRTGGSGPRRRHGRTRTGQRRSCGAPRRRAELRCPSWRHRSRAPVPGPTEEARRSIRAPRHGRERRTRATRCHSIQSPGRHATKGPRKASPAPAAAASCPYCAVLLQPPPSSSHRCARCRQRIVVRRVDGRAAYLTEAAVLVFEAERRRIASDGRLARERDRWLKLAATAGAPSARAARLAAARLSADAVDSARALYVTTVERSFQNAKRERRWEDASRIRREHALAIYRAAGSPVPVPAEIVGLHRDGAAAELRGIAEVARDAELVGASCCEVCRSDAGGILRIATELRVPRLPHGGCPKGLCSCRWGLPAPYRTTIQRYLRRRTRAEHRAGPGRDPATG